MRSAGQLALIDVGPDPVRLKRCLGELGIERVNLLILSHFDLDHVGGAAAIIGRADAAIVGPSDGQADDELVAALASGGAKVERVSSGRTGLLGELRWKVLWPPDPLGGIEPGNDASVTVAFEPAGACADGCLSSVFLGYLGESAQDRLLRATPGLAPVDIVKVAHHGSADQSPRLYERLAATVGVIGVGVDNGYGHPTDRLLDLLRSNSTTAARTDRSGLIVIAPGAEPGEVELWTERDGGED